MAERSRRSRNKIQLALELLQFLQQNRGVELKTIAKTFGYRSTADAMAAVDNLAMIGRPPYSPGDYIEAWIEDQRVYVNSAFDLERAMRLSLDECFLLYDLMRKSDQSLSLDRLTGVFLQGGLDNRLSYDRPMWMQISSEVDGALNSNDVLTISYKPLAADRPAGSYTVLPLEIIGLPGNDEAANSPRRPDGNLDFSHRYLFGFCLERNDYRLYRFPRIESVSRRPPSAGEEQALANRPPAPALEELLAGIKARSELKYFFCTAASSTFHYFTSYLSSAQVYPGDSPEVQERFIQDWPKSVQDRFHNQYAQRGATSGAPLWLVRVGFTYVPSLLEELLPVIDRLSPLCIVSPHGRHLAETEAELKALFQKKIAPFQTR